VSRASRGAIRVEARIVDGALRLCIEDDGGVLAPSGTPGITVINLRTRLAALHGEDAGLALRALLPAGVRAELRVPCAS